MILFFIKQHSASIEFLLEINQILLLLLLLLRSGLSKRVRTSLITTIHAGGASVCWHQAIGLRL